LGAIQIGSSGVQLRRILLAVMCCNGFCASGGSELRGWGEGGRSSGLRLDHSGCERLYFNGYHNWKGSMNRPKTTMAIVQELEAPRLDNTKLHKLIFSSKRFTYAFQRHEAAPVTLQSTD